MTNHNHPSKTSLALLIDIHVRASGPVDFESVMAWCEEQWAGGRPDPATVRRILADPDRYRLYDPIPDEPPSWIVVR